MNNKPKSFPALAAAALVLSMLAVPAMAQPFQDSQSAARSNVQSGGAMKIRDIERIVLPKMKGMTYVNFTYYPVENVYRLRFLDGVKAVDVDVDARTGRILGRSL